MIFFCIFVFVMLIIGDEKPPVTLVNIFLDLLFKRPQLLSLLVGISSILICINSPRAGRGGKGPKNHMCFVLFQMNLPFSSVNVWNVGRVYAN